MAQQVQMTNRQKVAIGATILDQDGQPYAALPEGATLSFTSSDPSVAAVTVREDGINADVTSGTNGTATITVDYVPAGEDPDLPSETVEVTVVNSNPATMNLTVGAPTDE